MLLFKVKLADLVKIRHVESDDQFSPPFCLFWRHLLIINGELSRVKDNGLCKLLGLRRSLLTIKHVVLVRVFQSVLQLFVKLDNDVPASILSQLSLKSYIFVEHHSVELVIGDFLLVDHD